ncbi:DUF445 domain-containing protein [Neomoorella mulderi]|uniref:DUF445 domain-containing protein n=1 Tax=Moorella mulderi DSM 14980 TaxID=1122241 RepID=A0A151AXI6_9FIRM|nr:DUF445 family protein [Moorella mulderi]KYH32262.1 hypothetical protein MOMUL_14830 [Moorella mulderi DSM 14980]
MLARWILIPLIGAFIGWLTNVVAIKMLFRPRRPVKIFCWTLQGLIPKRQAEIAANIAGVVDKNLLPLNEVLAHLNTPAVAGRITAIVAEVARRRLVERLPSFIPQGLKEAAGRAVEETLHREMPPALQELIEELGRNPEAFSIGEILAAKFKKLNLNQVEEVVVEVAGRELRYIEWLGGLLGFLIGLVQAALAILS